jgi:hypothetical protein
VWRCEEGWAKGRRGGVGWAKESAVVAVVHRVPAMVVMVVAMGGARGEPDASSTQIHWGHGPRGSSTATTSHRCLINLDDTTPCTRHRHPVHLHDLLAQMPQATRCSFRYTRRESTRSHVYHLIDSFKVGLIEYLRFKQSYPRVIVAEHDGSSTALNMPSKFGALSLQRQV